MVTFALQSKTDITAVYSYYPEDDRNAAAGLITVDLRGGSVKLDKAAEEDYIRTVSAAELNEMRESINLMRAENGKHPLTEEELPTAESGERYYYYAEHVIRRLRDELEQGELSEKGTVAWY